MKFETSDKTASFGKKPHVKKGYYPAKLLKIDPYADKDGNMIEGKYGHQLIFEFAIYAKDENDTPTSPMMFEEEGKDTIPVKISKFVYHIYKDQKTGVHRTAFTPDSAVTRLCKALGWTFAAGGIDMDPFIGNWVEVNLNDFEVTKNGETYTASSIADVEPYTGKDIPESLENVNATKKPESVSKQIKHTDAETPKEESSVPEKEVQTDVDDESPEGLKSKIEKLNGLHKDGFLSNEGHKQAVEQLQAKLDSLNK